MKFVLNEYKGELKDEDIINDIKRVAKEVKKDYISISIYKKKGKYSQTAIQGHFGTWKNALLKAGLRNERLESEYKQIKNEDYYMDLKRVSNQLKRILFYLRIINNTGNSVQRIFSLDLIHGMKHYFLQDLNLQVLPEAELVSIPFLMK